MTLLHPVRRSSPLVIILLCVGSLPGWCQAGNVQNQLNSAYKSKILLLRNFYSGSDLRYDQNGILTNGATPGPWTLADVEITGVTATAQEIEIVGTRLSTLYKEGKPSFVRVGTLKIHVARPVSDVDTEAALHPIFDKIFIAPGEDLRPLVPEYWRYYLAGTDSKTRSAAWRATLDENETPTVNSTDAPAGEVTPPRAIYTPDPKYPKEAASQHIEGVSRLGMVIDTTGTPGNIAILQPLGMGLDEQAILALKQWKFKPSTKNGQPVRVQINVEIPFRCCP